MELFARSIACKYVREKNEGPALNFLPQKMRISNGIVKKYYKLLTRNDIFRKRGQELIDIWDQLTKERRKRERKMIRAKMITLYEQEFGQPVHELSWGTQPNKDYNYNHFVEEVSEEDSLNDNNSEEANNEFATKKVHGKKKIAGHGSSNFDKTPKNQKPINNLGNNASPDSKLDDKHTRFTTLQLQNFNSVAMREKQISSKRISVIINSSRNLLRTSNKNINTNASQSSGNSSVFELLENVKKEMSQAHNKEWLDPTKIPSIENLFAGLDEANTMDKKEILSQKNSIYKYLSTTSNMQKIKDLSEKNQNLNIAVPETTGDSIMEDFDKEMTSESRSESRSSDRKSQNNNSKFSPYHIKISNNDKIRKSSYEMSQSESEAYDVSKRSIKFNNAAKRNLENSNTGDKMLIYDDSYAKNSKRTIKSHKNYDLNNDASDYSIDNPNNILDIKKIREIKAPILLQDRSPTKDIQKTYNINRFITRNTRKTLLNKIDDNIHLLDFVKEKKQTYIKTQESEKEDRKNLNQSNSWKFSKDNFNQGLTTLSKSHENFKSIKNSLQTTCPSTFGFKNLNKCLSQSARTYVTTNSKANYMDESNVSSGFRIGPAVPSKIKTTKMNTRSFNRNLKNKIIEADTQIPNNYLNEKFSIEINKNSSRIFGNKPFGKKNSFRNSETAECTKFEKEPKKRMNFFVKTSTYQNLAEAADRQNIFKLRRQLNGHLNNTNHLAGQNKNELNNKRLHTEISNEDKQYVDIPKMKQFTEQLKTANSDRGNSAKNMTETTLINGKIKNSLFDIDPNLKTMTQSSNMFKRRYTEESKKPLYQKRSEKFTKVLTERFFDNTTKLVQMQKLQDTHKKTPVFKSSMRFL